MESSFEEDQIENVGHKCITLWPSSYQILLEKKVSVES